MKYAIDAFGAPEANGPYSQGTTAGRLIFVSGQLPIDSLDNSKIIDGDITVQTERVIYIIEQILAEVGCNLSDVAQTTVYLANIDDLDAMNRMYERRFIMPAPARTVVEVSALPMGALIEMDCVACR